MNKRKHRPNKGSSAAPSGTSMVKPVALKITGYEHETRKAQRNIWARVALVRQAVLTGQNSEARGLATRE